MFSIISRLVFSDGVYMSSAFWSAETHLDNQGNIIVTLGEPSEHPLHCFPFKSKNIEWKLFITFAILVSSTLVSKYLNLLYAFLLSIPAILSLTVVFSSLLKLLFKEKNSTARYHTALHQVMNAYQSLGRVPTIEEAKSSPIYLKNCFMHTNFQTILKQLPIILIAFLFNSSLTSLVILLIIYFSWELFVYPKVENTKFMYCLDGFVLPRSTDKELEVVLECLNALMDIPYDGFQNIYRG